MRPTIVRDHRVIALSGLAETRIWNPELAGRMQDLRNDPVLPVVPGCPAGGEHEHGGSADYTLVLNRSGAQGQPNWRWCRKCQGLAYGGRAGGVCRKGGTHDFSQSFDYVVACGVTLSGHQDNWRWCRKCDGMAYNGQPSCCPGGGAHDHTGSGAYFIAMNQPEAEGQPNWRRCSKCMGLVFAGGPVGATRDELGLPVASSNPVDDSAVFEAATGPERYHLPRYDLARRVVNGLEQYQIRMAPDEAGHWSLSVTLDKLRPDRLPPDTLELEHEILLRLGFAITVSGGGLITKSLDFSEVGETEDKTQLVARMHFATPAECGQVLEAITNSGSGCGMTVMRSVRVAAPIPGALGRFHPVTYLLEQTVPPDPLFLHPALHPYLCDGAAPTTAGGPGLVPPQLQYGGMFHKYWVDVTNPNRVCYLPDAFRISRRDTPAPFVPLMSVRLVPGDTADADPMVSFDFFATPWTDVGRLEAARKELAKDAGSGAESLMSMEPLPADSASFWLALPGASGGGMVERVGALIDLRGLIIDSETLSQEDFKTIFDAMTGGALSIMRGEVRIDLGQGATERIPFEARFDRINGEVLEPEVTPGLELGQFNVALRNAIESPLRIERLTASVLAGDLELDATETVSSPLPMTLEPGAVLKLAVAVAGAIPEAVAGQPLEPLLNLDGVRPLPDVDRIWASIFDDSVIAAVRRTVRVKVYPFMFDAPPERPADKVHTIIVRFEGGAFVELTPDSMEGEVQIPMSITHIMRPSEGSSAYRYKIEVVLQTNRRLADSDWLTHDSDLLTPSLPIG